MEMSLSKLRETMKDREAWCVVVHGVTKSQILLSNWTEMKWTDGIMENNLCETFVEFKKSFIQLKKVVQ